MGLTICDWDIIPLWIRVELEKVWEDRIRNKMTERKKMKYWKEYIKYNYEFRLVKPVCQGVMQQVENEADN